MGVLSTTNELFGTPVPVRMPVGGYTLPFGPSLGAPGTVGLLIMGGVVSVHRPSISTCMGDLPVWSVGVEHAVISRVLTRMPWTVLGGATSPHAIVI